MGIFSEFFKKPKPILNEEDLKELKNIERETYMQQARIIIAEKGKRRAIAELGFKEKKNEF